jgi:hypothetical protein
MWSLLRRILDLLFNKSTPVVDDKPPPVEMLLPRQKGKVIPSTFFGLHYVKVWIANYPSVPFGFYRLLNATPRWHTLHQGDGEYADGPLAGTGVSRIDSVLWCHAIRGAGQPVMFTLAGGDETDQHNGVPPFLQGMENSRVIGYWRQYVTMMAERFKGRIKVWEVWNEPDLFFPQQELLVELCRHAHAILKQVDPENVVLTPAFTTLPYAERFLQLGGGQFADVLSTHMDGRPNPEGFDLTHIRQVEALREKYMPTKPHWITEGHSRGTGDRAHDPGIVMRAYLLYWVTGVHKYCWYGWDFGSYDDFPGIDWVLLADHGGNPLGGDVGYTTIYNWLVGRSVESALRDGEGNWTVLLDNGQKIRWNENRHDLPSLE